MIEQFCRALAAADVTTDGVQIAEILWLAAQLPAGAQRDEAARRPETSPRPERGVETTDLATQSPPAAASGQEATVAPVVGVYSPASSVRAGDATTLASRIALPAAPALPNITALARGLKPLRRRFPSRMRQTIDEDATVTQYADFGILSPVMQPELERWFDVALVVEDSPSMVLWKSACAELYRMLVRHGSFRDVRRWSLLADHAGVRVASEAGLVQSPRAIADPASRRLILVATDCISGAWDQNAIWQVLGDWAEATPVALMQMLPERLWLATGMGTPSVVVRAQLPGLANRLLATEELGWDIEERRQAPPLPVCTLEERPFRDWARMVMGSGGANIQGVRQPGTARDISSAPGSLTGAERVQAFRSVASPVAFELACYLSAVDLTLPIMRLVQRAMLPDSSQVHFAEFFLGGLIERVTPATPDVVPDGVRYEFYPDVRELLQRSVLKSEALKILQHVSAYVKDQTGYPVDFTALVPDEDGLEQLPVAARPFARIGTDLLRQFSSSAHVVASAASPPSAASPRQESAPEDGPEPVRSHIERVVVAHAADDRQHAEWLTWHLVHAGYQTALVEWRHDARLAVELASAVMTGDHVVLVVSGAFDDLRQHDVDVGLELASVAPEFGGTVLFALFATDTVVPGLPVSRTIELADLDERTARSGVVAALRRNGIEPLLQSEWPSMSRLPDQGQAALVRVLAEWAVEDREALLDGPVQERWVELLTSVPDRTALYDRALQVVAAVAQSDYVQLALRRGDELNVVADQIGGEQHIYLGVSWEGVFGRAAVERRPVWAPQVKLDSGYIPAEPSTQAELALPLMVTPDSAAIGAINCEWPMEFGASLAQVVWLEQFAARVAEALERFNRVQAPAPRSRDDALAAIELHDGDLFDEKVDAIVLAAPRGASGVVASQLRRRLKVRLPREVLDLPAGAGQAYAMPVDSPTLAANYAIFTRNETSAGEYTAESIASAVRAALEQAERLADVQTAALPALGTSQPFTEAQFTAVARASLEAVAQHLEAGSRLKRVVFSFVESSVADVYRAAFLRMHGATTVRVPGFVPSAAGFQFASPDDVIPEIATALRLGPESAAVSLAGGLAFAARDYFEAGATPPATTEPPTHGSALHDYLARRMLDSFDLPDGLERRRDLTDPALPDAARDEPRRRRNTRAWRLANEDWPAVRADIDARHPVPIGLITTKSNDVRDLASTVRTVLAYGYDALGSEVTLYVYDPMLPGRDDVQLLFRADPDGTSLAIEYSAHPEVVTFFPLTYSAAQPPELAAHSTPVSEPFDPDWIVDRRLERDVFQRMLIGQEPRRLLCVVGERGIGKSFLLRHFRRLCSAQPRNVPVVSIGSRELHDAMTDLSALVLDGLRAAGLKFELAEPSTGDGSRLAVSDRVFVQTFRQATSSEPVVILVDDCDVDPLAQWVRTILLFAQRGTRAIVVVASSAPATPQFPDAVVVDLQPFSDKDIEEFCVVNNISPSRELIESLLALESPGRIAEALHRLGAATQEPR